MIDMPCSLVSQVGEVELSERDIAMLKFERQWWRNPALKNEMIRREFGVSPVRYFQQLNGVISRPEALDFDPGLVRTLLRRRGD